MCVCVSDRAFNLLQVQARAHVQKLLHILFKFQSLKTKANLL